MYLVNKCLALYFNARAVATSCHHSNSFRRLKATLQSCNTQPAYAKHELTLVVKLIQCSQGKPQKQYAGDELSGILLVVVIWIKVSVLFMHTEVCLSYCWDFSGREIKISILLN